MLYISCWVKGVLKTIIFHCQWFGTYIASRDLSQLPSFSYYIKQWKLAMWEMKLFQKFKSKDGIWQNKAWEQWLGGNEVLKWILFKSFLPMCCPCFNMKWLHWLCTCFKFVLFWRGATKEIPKLCKFWKDPKLTNNTMYKKDLWWDWVYAYLYDYPWFLDYPKNNTPTS